MSKKQEILEWLKDKCCLDVSWDKNIGWSVYTKRHSLDCTSDDNLTEALVQACVAVLKQQKEAR